MGKARRGRGEGSVFQRKSDGYWIARVPGRDAHGRPVRVQLGARARKADALDLLSRHFATGAVAARGSVGEYLDRWLRDVAPTRLDEGSIPEYERLIRRTIVPSLGRIALVRLDPQRIAAFYTTLAYGPAMKRKVHAVLRSALETAVAWNLIPYNPAARGVKPRYTPPERPTLDLPHAHRLLELVAADRLAGVYAIAISMGLRQGEILGLQWSDIAIDTPCARCRGRGCRRCGDVGFVGIIALRHSLQDKSGRLRLKGLKRERQRRDLPIPPLALLALRARRAAAIAEDRDVRAGHVFTSTAGTPIYKSNLYRSWSKIRAQLQLPSGVSFHFHDLRHTLGQIQRLAGADSRDAARTARPRLGHDHGPDLRPRHPRPNAHCGPGGR